MYLKELTINGFKSFAKKSELEFCSQITAIVGPNGSGKSNVAESFRFVLGEQSVKSMRGKRGEDLIWGGSEKVSRANRANVVLCFDNTSRVFPLDFDEVRVERSVHRDGQNEYKLNGSTVRLKDIHELLAAANIGSTGHHIISQGEADRVLAAGPKERREIIEDALGLKVYQLKKQEAERKLERTRQNIAQVESLRREAAPHLKYLKKQVEKLERSLEVQQTLRVAYAEYLKREDVYVAFHHDRLTAERREPAARLDEVETRLAEVRESLKQSEVKTEESVPAELQKAHQAAVAARAEAERAFNNLEGQITFLAKRLARPLQPIKESVVPRSKLEALVSAAETKDIERADVPGLRTWLKELLQELRALLAGEVEASVDTTASDRAELERLEHERDVLAIALEEAKLEERSAAAALESAEQARQEKTEAQHSLERELFSLQHERRELELTRSRIDQELAVLERDRADFKQQLQEAVALLGRGATDYYRHELRDTEDAVLSDSAIAAEDRAAQRTRQHELEKLKIRLEELGTGATEDLLKEYEEAKERDEFLARELTDLQSSVENLLALISDLEQKLHEQFSGGVEKIGKEFQTFFTLMFGGGSAALEMVKLKSARKDEDDDGETAPSEIAGEGVELSVSLPNKRVKGLEMLSGGERALTSIALIFAMSQVNPPPFIILDETDAALDEANSRRYGDMIEALAKKSQLVLITHNRETMSRAGVLYGITMGGDGVSKVLSVKFDEAVAVAK